ncbi:hypothetical protein DFH09DRAFT_1109178 [Mycena vulgaris]|nr:hypothetical protein DFH09DRAFT_1109178 [Mycena vulgaris]
MGRSDSYAVRPSFVLSANRMGFQISPAAVPFSTVCSRPLGPSTIPTSCFHGSTSILREDVRCARYFAENQDPGGVPHTQHRGRPHLRVARGGEKQLLYDQDMQTVVDDFDTQAANRLASGEPRDPHYRMSMVVQSISFHSGVSGMQYHKNWYFECDSRMDYSLQWRPPAGDWLGFLKETVSAGKGWDPADINFLL